jgi:hypothetical protein
LLDPFANSPLKIWEVQSANVERLKEEGWEPKLRLTSDQEHVIENKQLGSLKGLCAQGSREL